MPRALAVLLAMMLVLAGCGGDDSDSSSDAGSDAAAADVDFPASSGKSMRGLRENAPEAGVFAPTGVTLRMGSNRLGFAVFDVSRAQIDADAVAIYVSDRKGRKLSGPFRAREESLRVKPQFMSRQTAADLDDIDQFWVADVDFPARGRYVVTALAATEGSMISTNQMEMIVGADGGPPDITEKAIRVHTDTVASAGGNLKAIDTRLPPLAELHEDDFYDVVGKKPVVLAFATPQLCASRVCGPIVDVMAEVRNETDADIAWIHQEIFTDNEVKKGYREPVVQWRLPSEPWTFLIGSDGRVVERFEGALSVRELSEAVQKLD